VIVAARASFALSGLRRHPTIPSTRPMRPSGSEMKNSSGMIPITRPSTAHTNPPVAVGRSLAGGVVVYCGAGGGSDPGVMFGGYHFPSDACHQPSPTGVSLIRSPLVRRDGR
jgi:hypothetical protein